MSFFWEVTIFNFYFEEELRNYKGNPGSLDLFWSYKVLEFTFLHSDIGSFVVVQ
jgi:hypothetical protein